MNRRRLKKLRNTLRDLRPCTDIRDAKMQTGYTGTVALTDTETLCTRASGLPPIDTLDMRVEHGVHDDGGSRQVLGCISAVAILMYPHQAAEAARILEQEVAHYDATDVAKEILGLDDEQAEQLCLAHPEQSGQQRHPVTPWQAALTVERILAGTDPLEIWDHVRPAPARNEDDPEDALRNAA